MQAKTLDHREDDDLLIGHVALKLVKEVVARMKSPLNFLPIKASSPSKWAAIRGFYKQIDTDKYDPYIVDWTEVFSPIERMAWGEIRRWNLPLWPQFPIGRFFADFACPRRKIAIECDGKEFHDEERDRARDFEMVMNGWVVYRISGSDCNRIIPAPWEEFWAKDIDPCGEEARAIFDRWALMTIDGLIASVAQVHFGVHVSGSHFPEAAKTALFHRSGRWLP